LIGVTGQTDYRLLITDYHPYLMFMKHVMRMIMPVRFSMFLNMLMDEVCILGGNALGFCIFVKNLEP
jgi:hypothetical protein